MKHNGSKFLLISILTFIVGVGIVIVWQFFTNLNDSGSTPPILESGRQNVQDKQPDSIYDREPLTGKKLTVKKWKNDADFCREIKKDPNYPHAEPMEVLSEHPHVVSGGVMNGKVCNPALLKPEIPGEESVTVQVTVDENGFVISASTVSKTEFPRRFEQIARSLRVRPAFLNGIYVKTTGVLIFER